MAWVDRTVDGPMPRELHPNQQIMIRTRDGTVKGPYLAYCAWWGPHFNSPNDMVAWFPLAGLRNSQGERRRRFRVAQRRIAVNKRPYVRMVMLSGRWP